MNPAYQARGENLFVVAVNCGRAAATCFCTSMGTGPAVSSGFDLCLTEMPEHFLVEVGTDRGGDVIAVAPWRPCSTREVIDAQQVPRRAEQQMEQRRHARNGRAEGPLPGDQRPARAAAEQPGARALGAGRRRVAWPAATAPWSAPPASAAGSRR